MRKEDLTEKKFPMNLQLFGSSGDNGGDGSEAGGDDRDGGKDKSDKDGDGGDDHDDSAGGDNDDVEEKRYSEADMEAAVQKRFAREKRKWQRAQQNHPPAAGAGDGDKNKPAAGTSGESDADKKARIAEEKAAALEMKWTCLEHDVKKDCVDDVLALAKVHMGKNEKLDIEDAIDAVLKKYPQFQDGYEVTSEDDGTDKKGWGQRHGKPQKNAATVEDEIRKQMFGK